jgi:hypothetical protein
MCARRVRRQHAAHAHLFAAARYGAGRHAEATAWRTPHRGGLPQSHWLQPEGQVRSLGTCDLVFLWQSYLTSWHSQDRDGQHAAGQPRGHGARGQARHHRTAERGEGRGSAAVFAGSQYTHNTHTHTHTYTHTHTRKHTHNTPSNRLARSASLGLPTGRTSGWTRTPGSWIVS